MVGEFYRRFKYGLSADRIGPDSAARPNRCSRSDSSDRDILEVVVGEAAALRCHYEDNDSPRLISIQGYPIQLLLCAIGEADRQ